MHEKHDEPHNELRTMHDVNRKNGPPAEQVERMFNSISRHYDLLNHLLSLGTDRSWRRKAVDMIGRHARPRTILDVATGTGDLALEIARATPDSVRITGADFSPEMVRLGEEKVAASPFSRRIDLQVAPCEDLPFPSDTFDSVTIAFGIRNVVDRRLGLAEMWRVLKPAGRMVVLEFSMPRSALFRAL
jgi:demethylmenaquinone methyltransferase/2-methoxy-6-polyprenyl-1,4-benzoquinol methylase